MPGNDSNMKELRHRVIIGSAQDAQWLPMPPAFVKQSASQMLLNPDSKKSPRFLHVRFKRDWQHPPM